MSWGILALVLVLSLAVGSLTAVGTLGSSGLQTGQTGDFCSNWTFASLDERAQNKVLCGEDLADPSLGDDAQSSDVAQDSGESSQSGEAAAQSGSGKPGLVAASAAAEAANGAPQMLNTIWYAYEGKSPETATYDPNTTLGLYTFGPWKALKPNLGRMAMSDMNVDQAKEELSFVTGVDGSNAIDLMQIANMLVALDPTTTTENLNDRVNTKLDELVNADQTTLRSTVALLKEKLDGASFEIAQLSPGSYMTQGAIGTVDRGKPTLHFGEVYRDEQIAVRITTSDGVTRDFRLACHFQLYFPVGVAPAPTMPTTKPGVTRDNELTPEPEPPTTTPTPPPTPPPPLEPKDPSKDPAQNGNAGNGGGVNQDPGPGQYIPPEDMQRPPEESYVPPSAPEPDPAEPAPGADNGGSGTTPGGGDDATTHDGTDAGQPDQGGDVDPDD